MIIIRAIKQLEIQNRNVSNLEKKMSQFQVRILVLKVYQSSFPTIVKNLRHGTHLAMTLLVHSVACISTSDVQCHFKVLCAITVLCASYFSHSYKIICSINIEECFVSIFLMIVCAFCYVQQPDCKDTVNATTVGISSNSNGTNGTTSGKQCDPCYLRNSVYESTKHTVMKLLLVYQ